MKFVRDGHIKKTFMNLDGAKANPIKDVSLAMSKSAVEIQSSIIRNSKNLLIEKVVLLL